MSAKRAARQLTTAEAAEAFGMTPAAFRGAMTRARAAGMDARTPPDTWPDKRTPLYDRAAVQRALDARPGRGWHGPRARAQ